MSMQFETWPIERLVEYARNPRKNDHAVDGVAAAIREYGFRVPIVAKSDGLIVDGHLRLKAAKKLGLKDVPVVLADDLTEAQIKAFRLSVNKVAELAQWDEELLRLELQELGEMGFDLNLTGFADLELDTLLAETTEGLTDPDDVPEVPAEPVTRLGDVWLLGRHRLVCGSSSEESAAKYFGRMDLVCTDPPYCSGGFQESGKSVGSVGTAAKHKQIANDRLSTRGYQSLIRSAVFGINAQFFYVFTDWHMWTHLYDIAESSSAGVRSMITWNKGTPGMGLGWRSQHELILWACRKQPPYTRGFPGIGNVISMSRQKNDLHTTQKPVELMRTLLQGAPFARAVAEPFCGSGSTLIACEMEGRDCVAAELDSAYVDVTVKRWQDFTGEQATLEGDGRTFADVALERVGDDARAA